MLRGGARGLLGHRPVAPPHPRGPVSRAMLALLFDSPPPDDPTPRYSPDAPAPAPAQPQSAWPARRPWWRGPQDVALALVLALLARSGELGGVTGARDATLGAAEASLSTHLRHAVAPAEPATRPGEPLARACHLLREVLGSACHRREYLPWLRRGSLGQLQDAIVLAAVQLVAEHPLAARAATPGDPAATWDPRCQLEETLGALGLDATQERERVLDALPAIALWRLALARHLARADADPAFAVGWLFAADAMVAAGRYPGRDALQARGFGSDTARAWESLFAARAELTSLAQLEEQIARGPAAAAQVVRGARAAVRSQSALESAVTTAWRTGRRILTWPGAFASEIPGCIEVSIPATSTSSP